MRHLTENLRNQEGATATEYVFLLVFIALAIIGGATALGGAIGDGMDSAADEVGTNTTPSDS